MPYELVTTGSFNDTIVKLQEHLKGVIRDIGGYAFKEPLQRIVCINGMSVSVQASQFTYATPRNDIGPWTHVELGYPSVQPPAYILTYAQGDDFTSTVYGYVPIELAVQWIDACGGLAPLPVEPSISATWELDDDVNTNDKG